MNVTCLCIHLSVHTYTYSTLLMHNTSKWDIHTYPTSREAPNKNDDSCTVYVLRIHPGNGITLALCVM